MLLGQALDMAPDPGHKDAAHFGGGNRLQNGVFSTNPIVRSVRTRVNRKTGARFHYLKHNNRRWKRRGLVD